ncbi:predicted protein [Coccidioides posadasii str. Silveira]|uniref:Predicted protein n=1 Tax=Coccidioides posadasii (strain RMSCC 757 / Silveira) TaxID=443226 RepID=E9DGR6_COCPS|nr:predicted protein [Coccidioides posadasii str. Silveira]
MKGTIGTLRLVHQARSPCLSCWEWLDWKEWCRWEEGRLRSGRLGGARDERDAIEDRGSSGADEGPGARRGGFERGGFDEVIEAEAARAPASAELEVAASGCGLGRAACEEEVKDWWDVAGIRFTPSLNIVYWGDGMGCDTVQPMGNDPISELSGEEVCLTGQDVVGRWQRANRLDKCNHGRE